LLSTFFLLFHFYVKTSMNLFPLTKFCFLSSNTDKTLTWRVSDRKQELIVVREHLASQQFFFVGVHVAQCFIVLCCITFILFHSRLYILD
jgi:hypothetical protein